MRRAVIRGEMQVDWLNRVQKITVMFQMSNLKECHYSSSLGVSAAKFGIKATTDRIVTYQTLFPKIGASRAAITIFQKPKARLSLALNLVTSHSGGP